MRFFTKKRVAVLVVLAVAAIAAVGAYAYFTSQGSGQGTFTSGQIGATQLSSDSVGPLYPVADSSGATGVTVHVNNTGNGNQYVGAISGTVENVLDPTYGWCLGSWFYVAPVAALGLVSPGVHNVSSAVALIDNGGNQNACANKTLTIDWTSASG